MASTMKDIAKSTGLGLATISSYFNGGNVRDKNRIKIEKAIKELQFEVNEVARGLKTNQTKTIGVVIPELNNVFCSEIITGVEDILRKHGYATIICDCRTDCILEKEAVEFLYRKRVDGIINMPVDKSGKHLQSFYNMKKPIVLIDRKIEGIACDSVVVDNQQAAKQAIQVLLEAGHKKIGFIGGPKDIYTAQERFSGYKEAFLEYGLKLDNALIEHGDYTIQGGLKCMANLLKNHMDMTAVFATNYEMTMGAMIGINEKGIKIPEQLSVIGFDNIAFAKAVKPMLTIVSQPTKEIAVQVANTILKRLGQTQESLRDEKNFMQIKLQTEILHGKSVCKL